MLEQQQDTRLRVLEMQVRSAESSLRPPRVLVASDQEWWIRSIESILGPNGYAVLRASTGKQVIEQLGSIDPDLVLIHSRLRDTAGVDLCRELRDSHSIDATVPVLIATTEPCRREQRLEVLRAGAWECVSPPLDAEELLLRLRMYVGSKLEADRAREESLLDPDTGLYSLHGVLRRVRELGRSAIRHHRSFACAVVAPAEPLMAETASALGVSPAALVDQLVKVLTAVGRTSDTLGRLSHSEFVVLAPETDPQGAVRMAQRLIGAAEAELPWGGEDTGGLKLRAGCYGVENFREALIEPVEMIVRATMALRRAQIAGDGEAIQFFDRSVSA